MIKNHYRFHTRLYYFMLNILFYYQTLLNLTFTLFLVIFLNAEKEFYNLEENLLSLHYK